MSIREAMNKRPVLTGVVVVVLVAVGGWFCYSTLTDRGGTLDLPKFYYYTVDEGKTLFSVSAVEVPPIVRDGKEAVRAHVFSCKGGPNFVGYLEKYTDQFKKSAEAEKAKGGQGLPMLMSGPGAAFNLMVKKPGDTGWVIAASPSGAKVTTVGCPGGSYMDLTQKFP